MSTSALARPREFTSAAVGAAGLILIFGVWIAFGFGGERVTLIFDDVTLTVVTLAMILPCLRAARSGTGRSRRAWQLFAASVGAWGVGEAVWTWYEVVLGREVPFPSLADVGYIGSYPLAAAAIILLPSEQEVISRVRVGLDSLLIGTSVLYCSWLFVLEHAVHSGEGGTTAHLLAVGYLLADVVLLSVVLTSMLRSTHLRRSDGLLAAGLASLCFADSGFGYLTATGAYSTGALFDIGWLAGFLLIGLAALQWRQERDESRARRHLDRRRWASLLATVPAVVVAALAPSTVDDGVLVAVAAVVFVLVVIRQVVIHRENEVLESRLRAQVDEVRNREERFAYAAKATRDAIWDLDLLTDEVWWGEGLTTLFGHQIGGAQNLEWWSHQVHPDDRARVESSLADVMERGDTAWSQEYRFHRADGTYASVVDRGFLVHDAEGNAVRMVGAMMDITERHRYEAELAFRAHHDALTGLPNRLMLTEEVGRALDACQDDGRNVALLFLDLDNFKLINDSYGHAAGDDVIVVLGSRLTAAVRPTDLVCRFAGDEFVVLCPDVGDEEDAARVATRILALLDDPVVVQGRTLHVSVSIGIAIARPGQTSSDDLLRHADTALYEAKEKGRARFEIFSEVLRGKAEFHIDLLTNLRRAFAAGELDLHYQAIVDMRTGTTVGAEALLRWTRDGEPIPPTVFVGLAEESGLIVPLGAWVLEQACRDASGWPDDLWVSVNVSPRQLTDELVEVVAAALAATGLAPTRLCIEITETANLEPIFVRSVLVRLYELGVHIAIDDFGTGHSSLSHLRELPVDAMKVDRSFVAGMTQRPSDEGIVTAVIALARGIGVRVIAEGVESEVQAEQLIALGCNLGQGYLFARPARAEEFLAAAAARTA